MDNKVKFGLKSAYYAPITVTDGTITYGTPVALPGAVSLSLDAKGDINKFQADDIDYFVAATNAGYDGDLELALVPDSFRKTILDEVEDANKVIFEKNTSTPKPFALLFEINGDVKATRHVFYNCIATRPSTESKTLEDGKKDPSAEKMSITATANANGYIKAKTTATTTAEDYTNWFTTVYVYEAPTP